MEIERRLLGYEIRVEDGESPKIRGYGAVFNSLSEDLGGFVEIIAPGAFARAIEKSDVRALINHDMSLILGRTSARTLVIDEDEVGLRYEIDPPETSYAKDLLVSLRRGDVTQSSFGFTVAKDEWQRPTAERPMTLRVIHEIERLYDVSPVTFPAYQGTSVSVRAVDMANSLGQASQVEIGAAGAGRLNVRRRRLHLFNLLYTFEEK